MAELSAAIFVFLVVENRLLRETLATLLGKRPSFKVCGSLPCLSGVAKLVIDSGTEVLLMDSVTARSKECPLLAELGGWPPWIKTLLIDMEDDPERFLNAVRAGIAGYLLKDASAAEVIAAVRSVAENQAVCSPQLCMTLFKAVSQQWKSFVPTAQIKVELGLTRRQQQLIPLVAQGLTNKEIACSLNLSEQTVKCHMYRIMRRVGATERMQVVDRIGGDGHFHQPPIS
jgi:DNA-binding NarL/FixJ family response regulator